MAIQFEYCFSNIGLCIDIYEYGMLSMGFDCCPEEPLIQNGATSNCMQVQVYVNDICPCVCMSVWYQNIC